MFEVVDSQEAELETLRSQVFVRLPGTIIDPELTQSHKLVSP